MGHLLSSFQETSTITVVALVKESSIEILLWELRIVLNHVIFRRPSLKIESTFSSHICPDVLHPMRQRQCLGPRGYKKVNSRGQQASKSYGYGPKACHSQSNSNSGRFDIHPSNNFRC